MKLILTSIVLSVAILVSSGNVIAQECPKYSKLDREEVQKIFLNITDVLGRLREISFAGTLSYFSFIQRQATNNEYQAILSSITYTGENPPASDLKRSTKNFLNTVVDSDFLGLTGTSLVGDTEQQARFNSATARTASINAKNTLLSCLN